jgi:hypothetical protein
MDTAIAIAILSDAIDERNETIHRAKHEYHHNAPLCVDCKWQVDTAESEIKELQAALEKLNG